MPKSRLKKLFQVFGIVAILFTVIPIIELDFWWIRMFDFPHIQLTLLTLAAFLLYFIKFDVKKISDYVFVFALSACLIYQFSKIYPYTVLSDYEVFNAENNKNTLSVYTCNVYQDNNKFDLIRGQIAKYNADIILLTETNEKWLGEIKKGIYQDYTYRYEVPKENTYGMALYSKLPLINPNVSYLVSDSVPSIHSKILLKSNDTIQLHAIHPTPPMPNHNTMSTDRDTHLMMIAKMALDSKYPVITVGDFNDVAWSETSKLFQEISRLLDVRKGRGFYNTYNAKNILMRWPLDHIFISSEFRLQTVEKCDYVGSDHFPLYTAFSFEPELKHEQTRPAPSAEDLKNAEDQIKSFKDNDKRRLTTNTATK